jgi:Cys-tRNA(Pro)/Cys-tRNA(Cys) deacylase
MSDGATPAVRALTELGVDFDVIEVAGVGFAAGYGEAVAAAMGVAAERVFKTLVARVDGDPMVAVIPVAGQLSLKRLAKAAGGKKASLADADDAQRVSGYVLGAISPFGQRRRSPQWLDRSAEAQSTIFVSGGKRGLEIEVSAAALLAATGGSLADLTA